VEAAKAKSARTIAIDPAPWRYINQR
jgi:hypothetical protein